MPKETWETWKENLPGFTFDMSRVILLYLFPRAAELMVKSGPDVTLRISKQGAIYHGLATLLSQPSPMVTKGKS